MSLHRRTFLPGLVGAAAGLAACAKGGQMQGNSSDRSPGGLLLSDQKFPVFSLEEYSGRLTRARHEMAERGIDLLYVTQPSNMCFLHGYAATWYRAASTSLWPPMAGTAIHVDHGRMIHFDYSDEVGQLKETSIAEDKRFFPDDQTLPSSMKFLIGELESEGWLKGSNVGLEFWSFMPSRAVSEKVEAALREAGARDVVDGSFVVRKIRRIKSPQEIAYIEEGVRLAELGLRAAEAVARPGVMECEVYGEAMRAMYAAGGEVQGINQGFNVRGLAHSYSGRNRIQSGDVGVFDLCGVYNRYHGNIARSMYFRDPDKKTLDAFKISAEAFEIVKEVARPGTDVRTLNSALEKHFKPKGVWNSVYYIGGYELGIAFPPDWVGEWVFDAGSGIAPGAFEAGMVTNFESIFYFEDERGRLSDTSNINTIVYGEDETRVLGSIPSEPIVIT